MNHYEILEVSANASPEVIKAAYKSLMQRYHPDRNPGNAEAAERSISIVRAYEVLSDPVKRAAYDGQLKLQSQSARAAQERVRDILAGATADKAEPQSRWWMWGPLAALFVAALWFMFAPSDSRQAAAPSRDAGLGSLFAQFQAEPQSNQDQPDSRVIPAEARTIPAFMKDVSVVVVAPPLPGSAAAVGTRYVLSIQTVGVVAGQFDPDKFMSFMQSNKDYINGKLMERLAGARYDLLARHDGDRYLKQYILGALGEITGTGRPDESSEPGSQPSAQYGAVDILLPDSYSVLPEQPNPAAVP